MKLLPRYATGNKYNSKLMYVGYELKDKEHLAFDSAIEKRRPNFRNEICTRSRIGKVSETAYQLLNDKMYYCFNCKNHVSIETLSNHNYTVYNKPEHSSRIEMLECPICKYSCTSSDTRMINKDYTTYRGIYVKDNKVSIKFIAMRYKNYNGNILPEFKHNLITFNMDSGYSYMLPELNEKRKRTKDSYFKNISYSRTFEYNLKDMDDFSEDCLSHEDMSKKVFETIREYKMKKLGCYIPPLEEQRPQYNEELNRYKYIINRSTRITYSLNLCCSLNRFPCLNVYAKTAYNLPCDAPTLYLKDLKVFRRKFKTNYTNSFKQMLEVENIKLTKGFKKYNNRSLTYNYMYYKLNKLGLKSSNILKLLDVICNSHNMYDSTKENFCLIIGANYKFFMKYKNYNENSFINKIISVMNNEKNNNSYRFNTPREHLLDTFKMSRLFNKSVKSYSVDLKNNFKYIHDTMSSDIAKLKLDNVVFNYDESNLAINYSNDFSYALAKDSYELIEVGTSLDICVGSYAEDAADGNCHIVIVRDSLGEAVMCIELNKQWTSVKQAKLSHNRRPEVGSDIFNSLFDWMEHAYVIPDSYDIDMNKTKEYLKKNVAILNNHNSKS